MNILLTPARIGPAEIPNRIVMPPMTTRGSDEEGHVTDQTVAYYMARVHGGVGLRIKIPGTPGVLRADVAHGLRDGAGALTFGWLF